MTDEEFYKELEQAAAEYNAALAARGGEDGDTEQGKGATT